MKKQRICIIGDGLAGLTTAITLNNLNNVEVHLIAKKKRNYLDKRATAISESNFKFLKENIVNLNTKLFWPSKIISLFYEENNKNVNFLNFEEKDNNLVRIFENNKFKNVLLKNLKKNNIKIINKNIKSLDSLKNYNLIILCLGANSKIYEKITKNRSIKKNYEEISVTGFVKHKIKNLTTSQFFLKEGPLAILPFSKNYFSFVWSLDKNFYQNVSKKIIKIVKYKIKDILKIKNSIQITNIQSYPIKLGLKTKYSNKNIMILGEGLHSVHPIAGQGFNLVLRDIKELKKILNYYAKLGILFNASYLLDDFEKKRKPENIFFGLGIDLTRVFFKKNIYLDSFKKIILNNINRFPQLNKISKKISNRGFI